MNAIQLENFRTALLNVLEQRASDRFGLNVNAVQIFLNTEGFRGSRREDINAELQYLADKQLVTTVGKVISPENTCWRITAAGRDELAANKPNE